MTKEKFAHYLSTKGYSVIDIKDPSDIGCVAIVLGRPNISHFTQVKDMGNDNYQVRIGVADYKNQRILKN